MSNKKPKTSILVDGKRIPLFFNHPPHLDVKQFATVRNCSRLIAEHPWLVNIKLYENPELQGEYIKPILAKQTIELSSEFLDETLETQRSLFIGAVCHMLATKIFQHVGEGEPYQLLVERYSNIITPNSLSINRYKQ